MNKDEEKLLKLKELFDEGSKMIDKILECAKKVGEAVTEEDKKTVSEEYELLILKFGMVLIKIGTWGER